MNRKFEDAPRLVSVYNTESEAVPPYAALEVFGYDESKLAFKVRKPTKLSHNDIMFNLGFIIPALSLGSAANTYPLSAAISQRGEDLGAGDVCGTYPGEWYLRSGATGFSILETIAGGRGVAVVVPTTGSLVEYVEPLGFGAESERPDGLPGNYINGQLYQLNPESGLFESQGESIWIAPSAPYKRATLAGNSFKRKVYVADIPDLFLSGSGGSGSGSGSGGPEHGGPGTIVDTIPSFSRCVSGVLQQWAKDIVEYPDGEISYGDEYFYGTAGCCGCADPVLTGTECEVACASEIALIGVDYNQALDGVTYDIAMKIPLDCSASATTNPVIPKYLFVPVGKTTNIRVTYSNISGWVRRLSDDTVVANYAPTNAVTWGGSITFGEFLSCGGDPSSGLTATPMNAFTPYTNASGELIDNPGGLGAIPGWLAGLPEATTNGVYAFNNPEVIDRSTNTGCGVVSAGLQLMLPYPSCSSDAYYVDLRYKLKFEEL